MKLYKGILNFYSNKYQSVCFLLPWNSSSIKRIFVLLMLVVTVGFKTNPTSALSKTAPIKDWTVLIYMEGENNLSPYALWDLYEMEAPFESEKNKAASSTKINVIAEINTRLDNQVRRMQVLEKKFTPETKYTRKQVDDFATFNWNVSSSKIISSFEDSNHTQNSLSDFLQWGVENYPAQNYWVIIWGHGLGWNQGFAYNEKTKTSISIKDLKASLNAIKLKTHNNINILSFDACFMQSIEMISELSEVTDFITGSNQTQSFLGLPYRRIFYEVNSGSFFGEKHKLGAKTSKSLEPLMISKMVPQLLEKSLNPFSGLQGRSDSTAQGWFTSSSIQTQEGLNVLVPALHKLASILKSHFELYPDYKITFLTLLEKFTFFQNSNLDIGYLLEAIRQYAKLKNIREFDAQIKDVADALKQSILQSSFGEQNSVDSMTQMIFAIPSGISVWMPLNDDDFQDQFQNYKLTSFQKLTAWGLFIEELHKF